MTSGATQHTPDQGPDGLDHLAVLERLQGEFLAGIAGVDPDARVPACGEWTARGLVEHLADIHHWAAAQARAQNPEPRGEIPVDLATNYAGPAAELRTLLGALPPDATARVLSHPKPLGDGPVAFWHRRQAHETLIHLHDLRAAAAGRADVDHVADVPAAIWADAIDEVVTVFQPRQVGLGRMQPLDVHVLLDAEDSAGRQAWILGSPGPDRAREVIPDVQVSGTARGLALLLWRRLTIDEAGVTIRGSRSAVEAALGEPIVP